MLSSCGFRQVALQNILSHIHTYIHTYIYIHIHIYLNIKEYSSTIKKKDLLPSVTGLDLEDIMPSEISQTEKDKHSMISLIC